MRNCRHHAKWPKTHKDFTIVDWSEDYDFIVKHFGGLSHTNNGITERTVNRCCNPFRTVDEVQNNTVKPSQWWKIKSDNGYEVLKSIPYIIICIFSSTRMLREDIVYLYTYYEKH